MRSVTAITCGGLLGAALVGAMLAPAHLLGNLPQLVAGHGTVFLLPVLSLVLVPGLLAGALGARLLPSRSHAWRYLVGLFAGGSLVPTLLLWVDGHDLELWPRLGQALFGGPLLGGFWLWLGGLLGTSAAYARMEGRGATDWAQAGERPAEPPNP
jgi:hypothetical protein